MSIYSIQPLTLGGVHTYPLASRKSKVSVREFAHPAGRNPSLRNFLDSLPDILASQDLRGLLAAMQRAQKQKKAILWGMGGHVIKTGLGPAIFNRLPLLANVVTALSRRLYGTISETIR